MTSHIITIGDELLIGQVLNTNQAEIAERLSGLGLRIERMTTVPDSLDRIVEALGDAWAHATVTVVTGGLGPTHDDVTKKAVCRLFSLDLVPDAEVRAHVETLLRSRNMRWSAEAQEQTMVPRGCTVLPNPVGTAPGLLIERTDRMLIVLPGVPYEMREILDRSVVPLLAARPGDTVTVHRTLRTTGIPESRLAHRLGDLDDLLRGASLAFLPSPRGVRLRITAQGRERAEAQRSVDLVAARVLERAGVYVYGEGEQELEEVLGALLTERRLSLAVAESCTGGLIADRLTDVSGSSAYFERGVIAYSNRSKTDLLGVAPDLIGRHGAVSREVAEAMAAGVRRIAAADIGLATTGIAGPAGGTDLKPVGLVWIGYADAGNARALRFTFGEGRRRVKERASQAALEVVRRMVLKIDGDEAS